MKANKQISQIILASTSPRRRMAFKLFSIKFLAVDSKYEEVLQKNLTHEQQVKFLALGKAKATAKKYPNAIIVAADTMVLFAGKIIGKPKNLDEARKMLKTFSGKVQTVMTGIAVLDVKSGKVIQLVEKNKARFKKLSESDIEKYVQNENPLDKAGGYNLQGYGFNLIDKTEGDFSNNFGLPLGAVYNALQKLGVKI